jgi:hypothetical protein
LDRGSYPDATANDNIFTTLINIPAGSIPPGEYAYQLVALDTTLNESSMWPYLEIKNINVQQGLPSPSFSRFIDRSEDSYSFKLNDGFEANFVRIKDNSMKLPQQGLGNPPRVIFGGFDQTRLDSTTGGQLHVIATVKDLDGINDVTQVNFNMLYLGIEYGGTMTRTGTSDQYTADYEYTLTLGGGLVSGVYINHTITAFDSTNQVGYWPLVIVE